VNAAAIGVAVLIGAAAPVRAQPAPAGRFAVAIGPAWFGGTTMAGLAVTETQSNGTPTTVFDLSRELASAVGLDARLAIRIAPHLDVEATASYARPQLHVTASNDVEGAAGATASESLREFTVGGGATWFFRRDGAVRTRPFVTGGVAYARQLHQTGTLADSGRIVDAGAGVQQVLRFGAGRVKAIGVRGEIRARVRPAALAVDARTHVVPLAAASLFVRF